MRLSLLLGLSLWLMTTLGQPLTFSNAVLSFPTTNELQPSILTLNVYNPYDSPIAISELRLYPTYGSPAFTVSVDSFIVQAGDSQTVEVTFDPRHNIFHNSELILISHDGYGALPVDLQGQGTFANPYYNSTENLSQEALKSALKTRISQGYNSLGYTNARNEMFMEIDNQRVNGQGATVNTLEGVYTAFTVTGYSNRTAAQNSGMNTEHTFPQGFFSQNEPMRSDLFHLFPTQMNANSTRANLPFGVVTNATWQQGGSKMGNGVFEPRDVHKGPVARAMFYFVIRYQNYSNFLNSQESILRDWHNQFLPDSVELRRNDEINVRQNNRNPFIDYPQFLERISSISGTASEESVTSMDMIYDVITFDSLKVGDSAVFYAPIVNTGNQPISLENIAISEAPFTLAGTSVQDTVINPGESFVFPVTISTELPGDFMAVLSFSSNVGGPELISIPLQAHISRTTNLKYVEQSSWKVFPQQTRDWVTMEFSSSVPATGKVYGGSGQVVKTFEIQTGTQRLSLGHLAAGWYRLQLTGISEGRWIQVIK